MTNQVTFSVFSENRPGVLQRITTLFTRRKVNIESLTVSETERAGVSRFTIVVRGELSLLHTVAEQIQRVIEVHDVYVCDDSELVFKEIAFFKICAADEARRQEIVRCAESHGGAVTFAEGEVVVIEKIGTEEQVRALYGVLDRFGIREFVRSGRIALLKHAREDKDVAPYNVANEPKGSFI